MTKQQVDNQESSEPLQDTVDARSSKWVVLLPQWLGFGRPSKRRMHAGSRGLNLLTPAGTFHANTLISAQCPQFDQR